MAMLILDGPHGTGKTTLVQETCPELPQPRCPGPENTEACLLEWVERWADSPDVAVFDHFNLFSYPVKQADAHDERFHREYHISPEALKSAAVRLSQAQKHGKALIIHAKPPVETLRPGQQEDARRFEEVFAGWDALAYDWTDEASREATKKRIHEFINAHTRASDDRPQRRERSRARSG